MAQAFFRFYAELNDFLPSARRGTSFSVRFNSPVTVKHLIESLGVPHTEVDLILVNSQPAGFETRIAEGDQISVYPVFESLDLTPVNQLHPRPLRNPRFVLDTHLGRLAAYLRLLGFDSLYRNDYQDDQLAQISVSETRILLTRDRGLLKRREITHGVWIHSSNPQEQVQEVIRRFDLVHACQPFTRCLRCNGLLEVVDKAAVQASLQPGTNREFEEFSRCQTCSQIYWQGSHYRRMQRMIQTWLSSSEPE